MSIPETIGFDNTGKAVPEPTLLRRLFTALVIILVALLSFGIGRLTAGRAGEPVQIEYDPDLRP